MAENKTQPTGEDVEQFLASIADEVKRQDCFVLLKIMRQITKTKPKLWASSMVGFGDHHYKYASGREGDTFLIGFSPRKQNLVLYGLGCLEKHPQALLEKLGKHKVGKGCLYLNKLSDVHLPTLRAIIKRGFQHVKQSDK